MNVRRRPNLHDCAIEPDTEFRSDVTHRRPRQQNVRPLACCLAATRCNPGPDEPAHRLAEAGKTEPEED